MTGKRFSHDGVVIINHLKKDLINIDGREDLLELAEYVDKLQEENEQLKQKNKQLKEHQKALESKIVRLKDRVKTFEKHYSKKDIKRYKEMKDCSCIISTELRFGCYDKRKQSL